MDEDGNVKGLNTVRVEWTKDSRGGWKMEDVPGSERFFPAQLVFLALGFLGPESDVVKALKVKQGPRSNIETPNKVIKC
jgi:glutamate synthase (NADH)